MSTTTSPQETFRFSDKYLSGAKGEPIEAGMPALSAELPGDTRIHERLDAFENGEIPWRVNAPAVLRRVITDPKMAELRPALEMIQALLEAVADRVRALDDAQLFALVFRLTLDPRANPDSERYQPAAVFAEVQRAVAERVRDDARSRDQTDS